MSWLFGINKNQPIPDAVQVPVMGGGDDSEGGNGSNKGSAPVSGSGSGEAGYRSEAYSFDSTALERAAKAAKVSVLRNLKTVIP